MIEHRNVRNWASILDDATLLQAERTARLPILAGPVALMPDAHLGIGATVGSVVATKDAVIPSAVGVDIGCVDAESEYLSPRGWRRIDEYDGGMVMQYEPDSGQGHFVQPERYIKREQGTFLWLKTKYGIDQKLTPDHRVLCWERKGRVGTLHETTIPAQRFADRHQSLKQGNKALFQTSFQPVMETSLPITDADLRVMVMVMADGHLGLTKCVVHFKKQRKIDRAEKLLADAGIEYTSGESGGASWFRFVPPRMEKSYSWCWSASWHQLDVIRMEALHWDGNTDDRCFYTRDRESADFIHYAFSATGWRSVLRGDIGADGATDWRVFGHANTLVSMARSPERGVIEEVPSEDGYAYCFTVPSGYWVMRRGGNIVMTGNCGMIAVETDLTAAALPDSLDGLMPQIERSVPAGVGQGHAESTKAANVWFAAHGTTDRVKADTKLSATALRQFGSLGGGNHFFEICLDERDVVWVVLHSGSRGVGNKLGTMHIKVAEMLAKHFNVPLEDKSLAWLQAGTPEFKEYIEDMLWAQGYALGNRAAMMDSALKTIFKFLGGGREKKRIQCHHNFCVKEHHGGQEVWVTRKGAISARQGELGIIPGSMGASTFIVEGTGSEESYQSCSHGAGRAMSRSEAKRLFTEADLTEQMSLVAAWNADRAGSLVDEIPSSYKDIEQVMADQRDLVRVQHTLHQILNFKGTN